MDRWQAAREFDALTAERDRLAAENAELRGKLDERDELQRRLDAVVAHEINPEWMDEIWTSSDGDRVDAMQEVAFHVKAKIRAIAEGRDHAIEDEMK